MRVARSKVLFISGLFVAVFAVLALVPGLAFATPDGPGWAAFGYFAPTNLHPGSTGNLHLDVYSAGAEPNATAVKVIDHLPAGWTVGGGSSCEGAGTGVARCELGPDTLPFNSHQGLPDEIYVPVNVPAGAASSVDRVEVLGGGASGVVRASVPATVAPGEAGFGVANAAGWIDNADGSADARAGSHPYEVTNVFALNSIVNSKTGQVVPAEEMRDVDVKLPPGFVGDPNSIPQCKRQQFEEGTNGPGCPIETMVGEDTARLAEAGAGQFTAPIYNLVPPKGVAAEFAFTLSNNNVYLDARVRSGGDDGITLHVQNVSQRSVLSNSATFWGVPGEASHDFAREAATEEHFGCVPDGKEFENVGGCGSTTGSAPFVTLPTSCGGTLPFQVEVLNTWQDESAKASAELEAVGSDGEPVDMSGCERLVHFEPSIATSPDTSVADSPAGLTADLHIPQGVNPEGLATSGLQDTTVTLPEGMAVNPGQATGLAACQPAQENVGGPEAEQESEDGPPECPSSSKVGTDEISTPLLPDKLQGDVYILQSNPPNLELLVAASGDGVNIKLLGKVHLDEATGRLTTTFENTPDFPVTEFKLSFSGGAQAALTTPPNCGEYETSSVFEPWSAPSIENALVNSRFVIASRPEGVPCGTPMGFSPHMTAGATTDQAGGFTGFSMLLQRPEDQQRVRSLSFKTPAGLSGMIASVPVCGEAQANAGTCPAASQIGHTIVGAGPGPYPLFIPQAGQPPAPIYLTGPYKGAPFGLSIVVPIVAGPFTLQTQIVRARIEVDPHTAQITVVTDPLPSIIDGIPADLRSINAVIDRQGFMFNPTNCSPMAFTGAASSTEGTSTPLSYRFEVGSCQALKFSPKFSVSTSGRTSKKNGASLTLRVTRESGPASQQANFAKVKIDLPKQLPSRLTTLQKACTAAQFEANPAGCPAASIVGHARVLTPELPVPLEGPAYFVSHGGEAFPSLIIVLQGDNVTLDVVSTTFISKSGVTSGTLNTVPDAPFTSFELTLPQGPYSAFTSNLPAKDNYNFCGQKLTMPTAFVAQNGAEIHQSTPISVTGCLKSKKAKAAAKGKKRKKA